MLPLRVDGARIQTDVVTQPLESCLCVYDADQVVLIIAADETLADVLGLSYNVHIRIGRTGFVVTGS